MHFLFRVCQAAVRRVENKQTSFPWGSICAAPGESYICGCLGNMGKNGIPSVIFFAIVDLNLLCLFAFFPLKQIRTLLVPIYGWKKKHIY